MLFGCAFITSLRPGGTGCSSLKGPSCETVRSPAQLIQSRLCCVILSHTKSSFLWTPFGWFSLLTLPEFHFHVIRCVRGRGLVLGAAAKKFDVNGQPASSSKLVTAGTIPTQDHTYEDVPREMSGVFLTTYSHSPPPPIIRIVYQTRSSCLPCNSAPGSHHNALGSRI